MKLKNVTSILLVITMLMSLLPLCVNALDESDDYELRILTFEDDIGESYWSDLIPSDQYSDPLLYGSATTEEEAYKWHDEGNTELQHTLPYNYYSYSYWGGGHAISNYTTGDFETYGDYESQLTVFSDIPPEEGLVNEGGGNNGSDNFAVHFGYKDNSGVNGTETLSAISFADGKARVIDHLYVNSTTYFIYSCLLGNNLTAPLGEEDWVKIIATGYNGEEITGTCEFYLADGYDHFVMEWTSWELHELGAVTKVEFNMAGSSDNGYGFSQPAYFAYDDVAVRFEKSSVSDINVSESETENVYDYNYFVTAPELASGKAIIALYSGKRFVGIDIKDIKNGDNDVSGSVVASEKPTRYKIMLWDGTEKLTPLCSELEGDIN